MIEVIKKMFVNPDIGSLLLAVCLFVGWMAFSKLVKNFALFCKAEQEMLSKEVKK